MLKTGTTPIMWSNKKIDEYATLIGRQHEIYVDGRADIYRLVADLGGTVTYGEADGALKVLNVGHFVITLSRSTSIRRDRFTLSHELGHYFLHYRNAGLTGVHTFDRGARSRAETEANVFASALLMPREEFRDRWTLCNADTSSMALHFDVSLAAAEVRAGTLGLTSVTPPLNAGGCVMSKGDK